MTADEAKRAAVLADALQGIIDVRAELPTKRDYPMMLQISAYEDEGEAGGMTHAWSVIDIATAPKILDAAEQIIRGELEALGVEPPPLH